MRKLVRFAPVALLLGAASSFAAVDASITTALTTGATDAGTIYVALVAIAVVGVGFMMGIKLVKKIPRAS